MGERIYTPWPDGCDRLRHVFRWQSTRRITGMREH
jgi:hypothetical protein